MLIVLCYKMLRTQRTGSESLWYPAQLGAGACGCAVCAMVCSSSSSHSTSSLTGPALRIVYNLGLSEQPSKHENPSGKIKTVAVAKEIFVLRSSGSRGALLLSEDSAMYLYYAQVRF